MKIGPTGIGACTSMQGIEDADEGRVPRSKIPYFYDRIELEVNGQGLQDLLRALRWMDAYGPGASQTIEIGDSPGPKKVLRLVYGTQATPGGEPSDYPVSEDPRR